jgi:hypothetical protein
MKGTLAAALILSALGIAGCATDPASSASSAGTSASLVVPADPEFRTGSRLPYKPPASQPVKGINNSDWKQEQHERPQPLPAGN